MRFPISKAMVDAGVNALFDHESVEPLVFDDPREAVCDIYKAMSDVEEIQNEERAKRFVTEMKKLLRDL